MALSLAHRYVDQIDAAGRRYRAAVYGAVDGTRWTGWIVFFPADGGRGIATGRETTQGSQADLIHWASGLTATYLEGALTRALALTPEAQMTRELERLARLEALADKTADDLEHAAAVARADAERAGTARDRAEEGLLATMADAARDDAQAHEAAAAQSRNTAEAANRDRRNRSKRAPRRRAAARKSRGSAT